MKKMIFTIAFLAFTGYVWAQNPYSEKKSPSDNRKEKPCIPTEKPKDKKPGGGYLPDTQKTPDADRKNNEPKHTPDNHRDRKKDDNGGITCTTGWKK